MYLSEEIKDSENMLEALSKYKSSFSATLGGADLASLLVGASSSLGIAYITPFGCSEYKAD